MRWSTASQALLKSYRVSHVTGDRYAGEFPRELFRKHGIAYALARQTKSELFRDLLPLLNSGRIFLPRNDRLQGQIVGLERRTSAVGRDTISHPDRGDDDVANAVAGAAALSKFGGYDTSLRWVSGDDDDSGDASQRVSVPIATEEIDQSLIQTKPRRNPRLFFGCKLKWLRAGGQPASSRHSDMRRATWPVFTCGGRLLPAAVPRTKRPRSKRTREREMFRRPGKSALNLYP